MGCWFGFIASDVDDAEAVCWVVAAAFEAAESREAVLGGFAPADAIEGAVPLVVGALGPREGEEVGGAARLVVELELWLVAIELLLERRVEPTNLLNLELKEFEVEDIQADKCSRARHWQRRCSGLIEGNLGRTGQGRARQGSLGSGRRQQRRRSISS